MGTQKQDKKGKYPRKYKFTDPVIGCRRNLKTEINKAEKKLLKLVDRNERGLLRSKAVRDKKTEKIVGFEKTNKKQGFPVDSQRAKKLKNHIKSLKSRLKAVG